MSGIAGSHSSLYFQFFMEPPYRWITSISISSNSVLESPFSTPLPAFVISSLCRWPFYRWCGFNLRFPNDSGGASLVAQMVKCQLQCGRPGFDPWVRKIPCRRKWQPTLVGKSHGLRSLVGDSPWGRKESDTTERLHFHFNDSGGWTSFHVPVDHSPISFGKISLQVLCPFLHWKTYFCFTVVAT